MTLPRAETFTKSYRPPWLDELLPTIGMRSGRAPALIVLDDDPPAPQTVYDLPVLTDWSEATLARSWPRAHRSSSCSPIPAACRRRTPLARNHHRAEHCRSRSHGPWRGRGQSRRLPPCCGHFPVETGTPLAAGLGAHFDSLLLIPIFLRAAVSPSTAMSTTWPRASNWCPPQGAPFAADHSFGYRSSNLRAWVAEDPGPRAGGHRRVDHAGGCASRRPGRCGESACGSWRVEQSAWSTACATWRSLCWGCCGPKRASASSIAQGVIRPGALEAAAKPLLNAADLALPDAGGALVVVGSYVPKSSAQLEALLATDIGRVRINVPRCWMTPAAPPKSRRVRSALGAALARGEDVVLYTSALVTGDGSAASLAIQAARLREPGGGRERADRAPALSPWPRAASRPATWPRPRWAYAAPGSWARCCPASRLARRRRELGAGYIVFPGNVGGVDALVDVLAPGCRQRHRSVT
ncbi:MAG: nucleotide-binding domain containing protein [Caldilineaceae bacterium]